MDDIYNDLLPEDWRDDPTEYLKKLDKVVRAVVNGILKIKQQYRFNGSSVTITLPTPIAREAMELMKDRIKKVSKVETIERV